MPELYLVRKNGYGNKLTAKDYIICSAEDLFQYTIGHSIFKIGKVQKVKLTLTIEPQKNG